MERVEFTNFKLVIVYTNKKKRKENERIFIDSSSLMIDGLNFKIDIF